MMYIIPTPTVLSPVPHDMIINNVMPVATPAAQVLLSNAGIHLFILSTMQPFLGLAGIPVTQQLTKMLQKQLKLPIWVTPIVALMLGLLFNIIGAKILGLPLDEATVIGLGTAFSSAIWHEKTKPTVITTQAI